MPTVGKYIGVQGTPIAPIHLPDQLDQRLQIGTPVIGVIHL